MSFDRFDLFLAFAALLYGFRIARPWMRKWWKGRQERQQAELEESWRRIGPDDEPDV